MPPGSAGPVSVAIALVNYCTPDLTIDCLRSLEAEVAQWPGSSVVVADNASPDGSGAVIAKAIADNGWSDWAHVLAMPENGGFSYGNNAVVREQLGKSDPPDYIWLLNTDTIVRPGALGALIDFMQANPEVGMTGSRLEHPDGERQCSAFRFLSVASEFEGSIRIGIFTRLMKRWMVAPPLPDAPTRFDWLSGASLLVRTDVYRDIGLMDEDYFLYFEEVDFCRRAAKRGWSCWYVPQSRVIHLVGRSTGVTGASGMSKRRAPYWFKSRRRYFLKHHGLVYATLADVALGLGTTLSMLRHAIEGTASAIPPYFLHDLARQSAILNPSLGSK